MKKLIVNAKTGEVLEEAFEPPTLTLDEEKVILLQTLEEKITTHIFSLYPDLKQKSDLSDKEYWSNYLVAKGVEERGFRIELIRSVENVYAGGDFETEVDRLTSIIFPSGYTIEDRIAIEQMLKVAVRVSFIQRVKAVYRQVEGEIVNAVDKASLPDLSNLNLPKIPSLR